MNEENIHDLLKQRILVLDGAMGTMLQRYQFSEEDFRGQRFKEYHMPLKGNNDLLSLTQPQAIIDIHRQYLEVEQTCRNQYLSSTTIAMADYGMEELVWELNVESAKLARKAADEYTAKTPEKPRFVAGSIGPTNKTASFRPM